MSRVVWIVGGGSGIGAAVVERQAKVGNKVVASGRRLDRLQETVSRAQPPEGMAIAVAVDARNGASVAHAHQTIRATLGPVTDLVICCGANSPRRHWSDLDMNDFEDIVQTNLVSVARVISESLPELREGRRAGGGSIVVVSSFAAWEPNPVSGVAYSSSKQGLSAICRTVNQEEAINGVRATHLCPGDVATDFLEHRPEPPSAAERQRMLAPTDVAAAVDFVLGRPATVRVDELVISPVR